MALQQTETLENKQVKITVSVDADTFQKEVEAVYRRQVGKINIHGFRKGKAPRKIIERMYGEGFFFEDAVNNLYPEAYRDALDQSGVDAVSRAEIDIAEVGPEGFTFTATVDVRPTDITVGEYKGLKAEHPPKTVPEAEIDEEIERLRQRNARVEPVERAALSGDIVVMDYQGFVGDTAFEGGTAENQTLELGSGRFIPGFEDQLVNASAGDRLEVNVTFPQEYHSEELSGKDAVFKVKVHEVKTRVLPEADDEFARDVSEFDTLEEYKNSIRKEKEERRAREIESAVEEQLIDQLLSGFQAEVPDSMVESAAENIMEDFSERLRMQGVDLTMYASITGQDPEKLREQFRTQAERNVKANLALGQVAVLENLNPTEEQIEAKLAELAESFKVDASEVREMIKMEALKRDMRTNAALDFLRENAVISEKAPEAEAEPEAEPKPKPEAKAKSRPKKTVKKAPEKTDETTDKKQEEAQS